MDHNLLDKIPRKHAQNLFHYNQLMQKYLKLKQRFRPPAEEIADIEKRMQALLPEIDRIQVYLNEHFDQTFTGLELFPYGELTKLSTSYWSMNIDIPVINWTNFILRKFERPFVEWKLYLDRAIKIVRDEASRRPNSEYGYSNNETDLVKAEVHALLDTIRLLEEQCEKDVKNHPLQEAVIRRRYRRAIDALKETS